MEILFLAGFIITINTTIICITILCCMDTKWEGKRRVAEAWGTKEEEELEEEDEIN